MSYARLYREAVLAACRRLHAQDVDHVRGCTHAATWLSTASDVRRPVRAYHFGTEADCIRFAEGLRGVEVVPMTDRMREEEITRLGRYWASRRASARAGLY